MQQFWFFKNENQRTSPYRACLTKWHHDFLHIILYYLLRTSSSRIHNLFLENLVSMIDACSNLLIMDILVLVKCFSTFFPVIILVPLSLVFSLYYMCYSLIFCIPNSLSVFKSQDTTQFVHF